jgi:hypothetical protein
MVESIAQSSTLSFFFVVSDDETWVYDAIPKKNKGSMMRLFFNIRQWCLYLLFGQIKSKIVTDKYLDSLKSILSDLKTPAMAALFSFFT